MWRKNLKRVEGMAGGWERIINSEIEVNKGINGGYSLAGRQTLAYWSAVYNVVFSLWGSWTPRDSQPEVKVQEGLALAARAKKSKNLQQRTSLMFMLKPDVCSKSETTFRTKRNVSHGA